MATSDAPLAIVFGESDGNHVVFALDRAHGAFIKGSISAQIDSQWLHLTEREGIEALALSHLRDDIRHVMAQGGSIYFGDHDYRPMVNIALDERGVSATLDLPSFDLWDVPLAGVTQANLSRIVGLVDEAEARFGPLTQHCDCGLPEPTWYRAAQ